MTTSLTPSQYSTKVDGRDKPVLLLGVHNRKDRVLLEQYLQDYNTIVPNDHGLDELEFDLCVVDRHFLQAHTQALRQQKSSSAPIFLPIILLTGDMEYTGQINGTQDFVDDRISIPVTTKVLQSRINLMLQTREYSLKLERKNRQLEEKNRQLRIFEEAIDSSNAGITISNMNQEDNPLVYCNRGFRELTGYSKEEILGQNCRFLQGNDRDQKAIYTIRECIEEGKEGKVRIRNYRKDGTMFWNDLKISPIRNEEGKVTHFVGIQNDVTELMETYQELKAEKDRLRLLAENSTDMISRHAPDGTYLYASPSSEDLLGFSPEELIGENAYDYFHSNDKQRVVQTFVHSDEDQVETISYRIMTKSGDYKWVETTSRKIVGPHSREVIEIQASTRDITERKIYEQELIEEKEFVDTALESMPGIFYMLDENMNFVLWNENFESVLGYTEEDILTKSYLSYFPEEDHEGLKSRIQQVWEEGYAEIETNIVTKNDEQLRFFLIARKLIKDGQAYLIGSGIDITARVEAEEKRRQSEALWEQLVHKNPGLVQLTAKDNTILFINPGGTELYGKEQPEQLIGKDFTELVDFDDEEIVHERMRRAFEGDKLDPKIYRVHTWDNRELYVELQGVRVTYQNQQVLLSVGQDVTSRIKYEHELERSLAEKQVLLQEIHHRVKNNLAIVSGLLELQGEEIMDPDAREIMEKSKMRIHSIAKVHELIYQHEELNRINFKTYISELTEMLQNLTHSENQNIRFELDLEEIFLNIDQAIPCGMVLNELITNSIKHAFKDREQGTISITLTEEDNKVHLQINDDGMGLPDNFDQEAEKSLGKTIINLLISQLQANFDYSSQNGSRFEITFGKRGYSGPAKHIKS